MTASHRERSRAGSAPARLFRQVAVSTLLLLATLVPVAQADTTDPSSATACDRLASDPHDYERVYEPTLDEHVLLDDAEKACRSEVTSSSHPRALFHFGRVLHLRGDPKAEAFFRDAAERGYVAAQFYLGFQYGEVNWANSAAERGHPDAQALLGVAYKDALDYETAVRWLSKAANQAHPLAQSTLAIMYFYEIGVEQDRERAIKLVEPAAESGFPAAQYILANFYLEHVGPDPHVSNIGRAVTLFRRAALGGVSEAYAELGRLYINGVGVEQNREHGLDLFCRGGPVAARMYRSWYDSPLVCTPL